MRLVQVGNDLQLEPDPDRAATIREVGFDRMSDMVSQSKVLRLLQPAVPGVIQSVFGELPTIVLNPISLSRLDGSQGDVVQPHLLSVETRQDTWRLQVELTVP